MFLLGLRVDCWKIVGKMWCHDEKQLGKNQKPEAFVKERALRDPLKIVQKIKSRASRLEIKPFIPEIGTVCSAKLDQYYILSLHMSGVPMNCIPFSKPIPLTI